MRSVHRVIPRVFAAAIFTFAVLFSAACFSSPSLNHEFHPPEGKNAWACLQYDDYLMMRCSHKSPGLEMDVSLLKPESVRDIVKQLLPRRTVRQRIPEFMPVLVRVRNWRSTTIKADFYRFRLKDVKTGKYSANMTPTPWYREHYTDGLGILDYYWAFEQKDAWRFLQPLPVRLLEREPDTPSPAERKRRRALRLKSILAGHPARTRIEPARSVAGFLMFFRPAPGRRYILEYGPPVPESGGGISGADLKFPPMRFRVQLTRSGELAPAADEKLEDQKVRRLIRLDRDERIRANRELFIMHRQLRKHARLRAEKAGKMKPDEIRNLFGD